MIVFSNHGLLDPAFIRMVGVSVKESENPIGFFGTGLKYAIAVLMRENQQVVITIGNATYTFEKRTLNLRGKDFEAIDMLYEDDHGPGTVRWELPFTTEYGKTWELWQAFRELYCNCMDEGGRVYRADGVVPHIMNTTIIRVVGDKFDKVFENKGEIILEKKCLEKQKIAADAHVGASHHIFQKGIRVLETEVQSIYTWNITRNLELTEDRTIKYSYEAEHAISAAIMRTENEDLLRNCLIAPDTSFEGNLKLSLAHSGQTEPTPQFLKTMERLVTTHYTKINASALKIYDDYRKHIFTSDMAIELNPIQERQLARAKEVCRKILRCTDIDDVPIYVLEMEHNHLGLAHRDKIFINVRCFDMGTKMVASTLYEEYLHVKKGYRDCTRDFQNHLFDMVLTLAERVDGEPI